MAHPTPSRNNSPVSATLHIALRYQHPRAGQAGFEDVPIYPHNINYTVHISSPASAEVIAALHEAVERACPILNLLANPQQISGTVELNSANEALAVR